MKLGIDYGTTTTLLSYRDGTTSDLINIGGNRRGYERSSVPSLIAITKDKQLYFGYDAIDFSGLKESDAVVLQSLKKCLSCGIKKGENKDGCWNLSNLKYCEGGQRLRIFDKTWDVKNLVKEFLEWVLGEPSAKGKYKDPTLNSVGISVPAIFGGEPRHTVFSIVLDIFSNSKDIDVINEPTAAIIACQDSMKQERDGLYAICDVGGGTTDLVLFEKNGDQYFIFKPNGLRIAGDDFDRLILDEFSDASRGMSRAKALMEVRRAKEHLTHSKDVTLFGQKLTRTKFETLVRPAVAQIVEALRATVKDVFDLYKPTSVTKKTFHLQKIFLSGGGARIPLLANEIRSEAYFRSLESDVGFIRNDQLYRVYKDDLPIVVVAIGASMPKGNIQDSVQYMLPYALCVRKGNELEEKIPIYHELPCEFDAHKDAKGYIEILAKEPNNKNVAINLSDELFSIGDEIPLYKFLQDVPSCTIKINEQNIMRIGYKRNGKQITRGFNLPWQGGIEEAVFQKYRTEWRRKHGYC